MAKSPYPIDPHLTGIAIAYKPSEPLIADIIAPYRTVNAELFEWDQWNYDDHLTIPDTKVGRMSRPNSVTTSAIRLQSSTEDYGLESPVPRKDEMNAMGSNLAGPSPQAVATEQIMHLVKLDREVRMASTVFNASTYPSTQRTTLSGSSQWSDSSSDPIAAILAAMDLLLIKPTHLVLGRAVWTQLRRHPVVVETIKATGAGVNARGLVDRQALADALELREVLVGESWLNTAKPGQAPTRSRVWGKHASLVQIDPLAQLAGTSQTFMMTARFGTPVSAAIPDPHMGLYGGTVVRAGESVKEVVASTLGAYYFQSAVA